MTAWRGKHLKEGSKHRASYNQHQHSGNSGIESKQAYRATWRKA